MTSAVSHISSRAIQVVVGIDTHQDQHVAVAVDQLGIRLNEYSTPATTWGYGELERWARDLGQVCAFGIEGTGSYGAVARFLTSRGYAVFEDRPDRFAIAKVRPTPPMQRWQRGHFLADTTRLVREKSK